MIVKPITLTGARVRLEPLGPQHADALARIGMDPAIWQWTGGDHAARGDFDIYVERAQQREGTLAFATVLHATNEVIGSTRFADISVTHRRAEIGWTWLAPAWQRTFVNTEAKLLLLRHAFETWGCQRVELKTHVDNQASRRAIERIGATYEGTHRKHMRQPDGSTRDTVYYSIIDDEWPAVRERLQAMLVL